MPSMEEAKRQVKAELAAHQQELDHDAILESLRDEIDDHNEVTHESSEQGASRSHDRTRRRSDMKFRFKGSRSIRKEHRRHHHRRGSYDKVSDDQHSHTRKRRRRESADDSLRHSAEPASAHPLPRSPTARDRNPPTDAAAAFRDSLFDALADDEGAAYWEGVYNQPIHIYPRPSAATNDRHGPLEQMNDNDYAAYVQTKMWERANPDIVQARARKERQRREEEEAKTKAREEFVRRKERAAWEWAETCGARARSSDEDEDDKRRYEYVFDEEGRLGGASDRASEARRNDEYTAAWTEYWRAWDMLKEQLANHDNPDLDESNAASAAEHDTETLSQRIPWPVLQGKPVIKTHIEDFLRRMPAKKDSQRDRLQLLKAERVRWHPDKIQQRFRGNVDAGTLKIVTGVFQIVDTMLDEVKRAAGA